MNALKLDITKSGVTITPDMEKAALEANALLYSGKGAGNDFLGWVHLPSSISAADIEAIEAEAAHSIAAIVISKSGTTTEPAIVFRIIKAEIERRYGKREAAERIVAVTDKARGALKTLATQEGYPTFIIPDDVGGRFSVLTPVGLLPLAVAGVNIGELVRGAREMEHATGEDVPFAENPSALYAVVRNELYRQGKRIEILGSYEPKLQYINEWWKQLYGESEGKDGKGLFPASVTLTADLHSMGQ